MRRMDVELASKLEGFQRRHYNVRIVTVKELFF
jgi:hypothetical protein